MGLGMVDWGNAMRGWASMVAGRSKKEVSINASWKDKGLSRIVRRNQQIDERRGITHPKEEGIVPSNHGRREKRKPNEGEVTSGLRIASSRLSSYRRLPFHLSRITLERREGKLLCGAHGAPTFAFGL